MKLRIIYQDTTYTVVDGEACSTTAICAVEVYQPSGTLRWEFEEQLFRRGLRCVNGEPDGPTIAPGAILKVEEVQP